MKGKEPLARANDQTKVFSRSGERGLYHTRLRLDGYRQQNYPGRLRLTKPAQRLFGGLLIDQSGNLYGTTSGGGANGGTIFELTPSSGTWTFTILYSLSGQGNGPMGRLPIDAAGNLYGMSYGNGAFDAGAAFKLTSSGATWIYTTLHDFTGGSDGKNHRQPDDAHKWKAL